MLNINSKLNAEMAETLEGIKGFIDGNVAYSDEKNASDMLDLESISSASFGETYKSVQTSIQDNADVLSAIIGQAEGQTNVDLESANDAMTHVVLAQKDMATYLQATAKDASAPTGGKLVGGESHSVDLEGFEAASAGKYLAETIAVNVAATQQSSVGSKWFPTRVVPAATLGLDVTVSMNKLVDAATYDSGSKPSELDKTTLVEASVNSKSFKGYSTEIKPVSRAGTDADLVSEVSAKTEIVDGEEVQTRPIRNNKQVNLLTLGSTAAKVGQINDESALDPVIGIDSIVFSVEATDGTATETAYIEVPYISYNGANLVKTADGSGHEYQTSGTNGIAITDTSKVLSANGAAFKAVMETITGATTDVPYGLTVNTSVSANANLETGNMTFGANVLNIAQLVTGEDNDIVPVSNLTAGDNGITITVVGYNPKASRTNRNILSRGFLIDTDSSTTFRFPAQPGSPFHTKSPLNSDTSGAAKALSDAYRARNKLDAIDTIVENAELLRVSAKSVSATNSIFVGKAAGIRPTYIGATLDIGGTTSIKSKEAIDDVRGNLQATILNVVNRLVAGSIYKTVLEAVKGANAEYDVLVATNPTIASFLMESGDTRFLGKGRKLVVTSDDNDQLSNKIYITLSAKASDRTSAVDAGVHVVVPTPVHDVKNVGGSNVDMTYLRPRSKHYMIAPVMGEISISNINQLHTG